jgi:hypothetical protein
MSEKPNFNETHPEIEPGEVFVGNIYHNSDPKWSRLTRTYQSCRPGIKAYTAGGQVLPNHRPVFVFRWEYDRVAAKTAQPGS